MATHAKPVNTRRRVLLIAAAALAVAAIATAALLLAPSDEPDDAALHDWLIQSGVTPTAVDEAVAAAHSNCALLNEGYEVGAVAGIMVGDGVEFDLARTVITGMGQFTCQQHMDAIDVWLASR